MQIRRKRYPKSLRRSWRRVVRPRLEVELLEGRMLLSGLVSVGLDSGEPLGERAAEEYAQEAGLEGFTIGADTFPVVQTGGAGESYMLTDHWGGAWSDADKTLANTDDDLMCWAAAAANVLEWTGWGVVDGMTNTDQIFQYFQDHWADTGGWMEEAWAWWFDGVDTSGVETPGGGFYPTEDLGDYYESGYWTWEAMPKIDEFLRAGYGVTASLAGDVGHGVTVWGFNYNPDDPSEYYGIWVTDSDDGTSNANDQVADSLRYYELSYDTFKNAWYLQDYQGTDGSFLERVQALQRRSFTELCEAEPDYPVVHFEAAASAGPETQCNVQQSTDRPEVDPRLTVETGLRLPLTAMDTGTLTTSDVRGVELIGTDRLDSELGRAAAAFDEPWLASLADLMLADQTRGVGSQSAPIPTDSAAAPPIDDLAFLCPPELLPLLA